MMPTPPRTRVLLTVTCAFVLAAGDAAAGTARRLALAADTGWLSDADETRLWYASLVEHPDQAYFEFGDVLAGGGAVVPDQGLLGHGGGARFGLGGDARWGRAAIEFEDDRERGQSDGAVGVGWARRFGRLAVGVGGRFTTFGGSEGGSHTGYRSESQYFHRYGMGLRSSPRDGLTVECAGELVSSQAESGGALHALDYESSWRSFGLRARAEIRLTPRLVVVPLLERRRDLHAEFAAELGGPADVDDRLTRAGLAVRTSPRTGLALVVGGEYRVGSASRRARTDDGVDFTWTATSRDFYHLRGSVAAEARIRPWLTLRVSAVYLRTDDDQERRHDAATGATELPPLELRRGTSVATPLAVGVGLWHEGWTLDLAWVDRAPLSDGLTAFGPLTGGADGYSALSVALDF
ncbi:hypothetical protein FJ250_07420 [bacterium]|nr:hypothetical protein [bacterium]